MRIPIFGSLFKYYNVFYSYAGYRLNFLCIITLMGGVCESIGISMMLPLLNIDKSIDSIDSYTKFIFDTFDFIGISKTLNSVLILIVFIFCLKGAFIFIQSAIEANIRSDLLKELRLNLIKKYESMSYSFYINTNLGFLNNVITQEIDRALGAFTKYIQVLISIIYISIYLFAAFFFNWKITLTILFVCIIFFAVFRKFTKTVTFLSHNVSSLNASIQGSLIQFISYFKYLKATSGFIPLYSQISQMIVDHKKAINKSLIINAIPTSSIEALTSIVLAIIIFVQVNIMDRSIADSILLLVFFHKSFSRVFRFQAVWQYFCAYIGGVEVVRKAIQSLDSNREQCGNIKLTKFKQQIELKSVNFLYGSKQVLFDINMIIPKNYSIGIIGESGAGKTTLFDLLTGLIFPTSGIISIDNIDYKDLDLITLRQKIGYVTQEPVVFNDSIENNISFWEKKDKNIIKKINKAAKLSKSENFIQECPEDYKTVIGDRGIKLSGGQRQRIAIAREIYKEPDIMIFDEATSSLDTESEKYIQESINNMKGNKTLIIIAHRLSTIKNCDIIYVLSKGRIVEKGSFEQLYDKPNSIFKKMCIEQQLTKPKI